MNEMICAYWAVLHPLVVYLNTKVDRVSLQCTEKVKFAYWISLKMFTQKRTVVLTVRSGSRVKTDCNCVRVCMHKYKIAWFACIFGLYWTTVFCHNSIQSKKCCSHVQLWFFMSVCSFALFSVLFSMKIISYFVL